MLTLHPVYLISIFAFIQVLPALLIYPLLDQKTILRHLHESLVSCLITVLTTYEIFAVVQLQFPKKCLIKDMGYYNKMSFHSSSEKIPAKNHSDEH